MKQFMPDAVTIFVKDGTTLLMMPNGDIIPALTKVKLKDNHNEVAEVTITLFCNVVGSELEANQNYRLAKMKKFQDELLKQLQEQRSQTEEEKSGPKYKLGDRVVDVKRLKYQPKKLKGTVVSTHLNEIDKRWWYVIQPDSGQTETGLEYSRDDNEITPII